MFQNKNKILLPNEPKLIQCSQIICAHSVSTIQDKCSTIRAVRVCSADYGVSYTKQRRWMLRLKRDVNRTEAEDATDCERTFGVELGVTNERKRASRLWENEYI